MGKEESGYWKNRYWTLDTGNWELGTGIKKMTKIRLLMISLVEAKNFN